MTEVHVYTDGACQGNQFKKGAIGGVGVWFGKDDDRNVSERLTGDVQTNNRAELTALIRAIETYYGDDINNMNILVIHTDSNYCKDGIETWIKKWKKNGWKTASKKPVKNQDLWLRLDALTTIRNVRFEWVKGHAGNAGNEEADRLATAGCSK